MFDWIDYLEDEWWPHPAKPGLPEQSPTTVVLRDEDRSRHRDRALFLWCIETFKPQVVAGLGAVASDRDVPRYSQSLNLVEKEDDPWLTRHLVKTRRDWRRAGTDEAALIQSMDLWLEDKPDRAGNIRRSSIAEIRTILDTPGISRNFAHYDYGFEYEYIGPRRAGQDDDEPDEYELIEVVIRISISRPRGRGKFVSIQEHISASGNPRFRPAGFDAEVQYSAHLELAEKLMQGAPACDLNSVIAHSLNLKSLPI
jgi:hypothetical protein